MKTSVHCQRSWCESTDYLSSPHLTCLEQRTLVHKQLHPLNGKVLFETEAVLYTTKFAAGGHLKLPSTSTVFYCWDTGRCPVQPQSSTGGTLGAGQYNHSVLLVGHWELASTSTVFYRCPWDLPQTTLCCLQLLFSMLDLFCLNKYIVYPS